MTRRVHWRVEIFVDCLDGPACGFETPGDLTEDWREVTCRECIKLCGFEPLTEVHDLGEGRIAA